jgi:hypothetical protein
VSEQWKGRWHKQGEKGLEGVADADGRRMDGGWEVGGAVRQRTKGTAGGTSNGREQHSALRARFISSRSNKQKQVERRLGVQITNDVCSRDAALAPSAVCGGWRDSRRREAFLTLHFSLF